MQPRIAQTRKNAKLYTGQYKITTCFHEAPKTVDNVEKGSAKSVVEPEHQQIAIENGTNTKFDAAGKDAAIRYYDLFSRDNENG